MGTIVEICIADRIEDRKGVANKAFAALREVEDALSIYREGSCISELNRLAAGAAVKVDFHTFNLIRKAIEFNRLTGGAFDITVTPVLELWGFGENKERRVPGEDELKKTLSLVGTDKILLDEKARTVRFGPSGMKIDLGGIAKGYAVDEAVNALKSAGVKSALVNAGGDIYALGKKGKDGWVTGIRHPRRRGRILARLKLVDTAIATSGDYEKYFILAGQRYSHIFNPKTGYPVRQNFPVSVTALAEDCITADALATAVFVLGPEQGMIIINELDGVEAVIVSGSGKELKIELSKGLEMKENWIYQKQSGE